MSLLQYIQGVRKGKDAHRLEREAMQDPFLADALDGYDKVKGNHLPEIEKLRKQILLKTQAQKKLYWHYWSIAVSILIVLGIGSYWFLQTQTLNKQSQMIVQSESFEPKKMIDDNNMLEYQQSELIADNNSKATKPQITVATVQGRSDGVDIATLAEHKVVVAEEKAFPVDTVVVTNEDTISDVVITRKKSIKDFISKIFKRQDKFKEYVKQELIYPTDEECKNSEGTVTLRFYVDENGRPYDITVKKSLCPSADQEAIRLLEHGPDWAITNKEVTKKINFR
jgi:TonB family protein